MVDSYEDQRLAKDVYLLNEFIDVMTLVVYTLVLTHRGSTTSIPCNQNVSKTHSNGFSLHLVPT